MISIWMPILMSASISISISCYISCCSCNVSYKMEFRGSL